MRSASGSSTAAACAAAGVAAWPSTLAALVVLAAWMAPAPASAGQVRGTVTLPAEIKSVRKFPGYWRVENGVVPVQAGAARGETMAVLVGAKGPAAAPKTMTVDIQGLQVTPALVVLGEGSVLEIRNGDRVPHDLSIPEDASVMPLQRLAPGGMRRQRFPRAGGYVVRSADHPQVALSVIVVTTPHHAAVDDKGAFKIDGVPEGKVTLKIWSRGRWVHSRDVDVGGKATDLTVAVTGATTGGTGKESAD